MEKQNCNHEWLVYKDFEDGSMVVLVGDINGLKSEKKYVCIKCGETSFK